MLLTSNSTSRKLYLWESANVIDYLHEIGNKVQQLEHQLLVDQQLLVHLSLADKVWYLKYLKSFDTNESIVVWQWSIFDQHLQVLALTTSQATFPMDSTPTHTIAQSSQPYLWK